MRVEIDDKSGFCFGVVRAIDKAERALADYGTVYSLGDIVHNRIEVQRLEGLGLHTVTHADLDGLGGRRLFIRAHGEPPSTFARAREAGVEVIDATCPVVAKLQERVVKAHAEMAESGGQVVILGKRGHAEVVGLTGQVAAPTLVVEREEDLAQVDFTRPVYFLSQTTQSIALFERLADDLSAAIQKGYRTYILSENKAQVERLQNIFHQVGRGGEVFTPVSLTLHEGFVAGGGARHDLPAGRQPRGTFGGFRSAVRRGDFRFGPQILQREGALRGLPCRQCTHLSGRGGRRTAGRMVRGGRVGGDLRRHVDAPLADAAGGRRDRCGEVRHRPYLSAGLHRRIACGGFREGFQPNNRSICIASFVP